MLKSLNIRNFAVIEKLNVEFQPGLNLLTGETGSGKSIIVDALGLLLGERSSLTQIRTGERSAFIEGIFEVAEEKREEAQTILEQSGIEENVGELLIRREISAAGKSRTYVNDRNVTLSILSSLQPLLVEIYGQGEQRQLLSTRSQLELLDSFGQCVGLRKQVSEAFAVWKNSLKALEKLNEEYAERERTLDVLQYQVSEIDSLSPQAGEDEQLAAERKLLAHSEKILQLGDGAYSALYESDASVLALISNVIRQVQELCSIDPRLQTALESLNECSVLLTDVAGSLRAYLEGINFSPEKFASVDNRLSELERLKRKFGADLEGILAIREDIAGRLEKLSNLASEEKRIRKSFADAHETYWDLAGKLSACRKEAGRSLEPEVVRDLREVALQDAQFVVSLKSSLHEAYLSDTKTISEPERMSLEKDVFKSTGTDQLEFLFSANKGESVRPLAQAASGGELSRLMLTLLTVGMGKAPQSHGSETIIFDEIDAGIGGGVAEAVGRRLKILSKTNQVICVTHQAQIARFADAHYAVRKIVRDERTVTSIELLQGEERIRELSRMIAGDHEAQTAFETARWMLENQGV